METRELTITLPNNIIKEINRYKKLSHRKTTEGVVKELLKYALTLPPYFKDFDWKKAEVRADKEISTGAIKSFVTLEAFLSDLKK